MRLLLTGDVHDRVPSDARLPAHNLLHSSGVAVGYDLSLPRGTRVVERSIDGREIEDDHIYTVATDRFLSRGYSAYRCLRADWEPVGQLRELVESGLASRSDLPAMDGRLSFRGA